MNGSIAGGHEGLLMATLGVSRCPIKSAIRRQTAHTARSSPLREHLQRLLLADNSRPPHLKTVPQAARCSLSCRSPTSPAPPSAPKLKYQQVITSSNCVEPKFLELTGIKPRHNVRGHFRLKVN